MKILIIEKIFYTSVNTAEDIRQSLYITKRAGNILPALLVIVFSYKKRNKFYKKGTRRRATTFNILIIGLIAGPAVSL